MKRNARVAQILALTALMGSLLLSGCEDSTATPGTAATKAPAAATVAATKPPAAVATQPQSKPPATPTGQALAGGDLAAAPYVDPDGYFKITPPNGWKTEEYPTDTRGKVAFTKTEGNQFLDLRVLVQITTVTDFQEFARKLKSNAANLGWQPEWQITTFLGLPTVRSIMTISAQGVSNKTLNVRFLDGNIYHDIQFSCPPSLFDKNQDLVAKSLATYQIVKRPSGGDDSAIAKQQQAEKYLRLAQIAVEFGDKKNALAFVEQGLVNDPANKDLLRLRDSLK